MTGLEDAVLGLFAKWPKRGSVKTRLAAETSPEFAATVAMAFLGDSIERLSMIAVRRVLAFAPDDTNLRFAELTGRRFELEPQSEGDLGERMSRFFARRFAEGAKRVVLLGSDSPTLPLETIQNAFGALQQVDVAIGPACDGGYYLIGGTPRMPALFADVEFGRPTVLAQTIARISPKTRLALLPVWYDVDTAADWAMLRGHLVALRAAGIDPLSPRTERLACESTV